MKFKIKFLIFILTIIVLISKSTGSLAKIVGNKIIFGSTISLTGKYSSEALLFKNNYQRFIDEVNEKQGIEISGKIYSLDIIFHDNQSNESRANQLTKRLIQNEGVQFLIGPHNFQLSNEINKLIEKNQLAIVSSYDALKVYLEAFTKLDTVDSKKIRKYIISKN